MSLARSDTEAQPFEPWEADRFLDWCTYQEDQRWELVDGFPIEMMAGATRRYDAIVVNIIAELRARLRGKPCRPFTADGAIQTRADRIRRPDVGVDCGPTEPGALKASDTRVVFEVRSPSNRDFDTARKIAEYLELASLHHLVLVSQNEALVTHWLRFKGEWVCEELRGEHETLQLDAIEVELPMREIYDGVLT